MECDDKDYTLVAVHTADTDNRVYAGAEQIKATVLVRRQNGETEVETREIKAIVSHGNQDDTAALDNDSNCATMNSNLNFTERNMTEIDSRSIYVGNMDYGTTEAELRAHFNDCGTINRVIKMLSKVNGRPKAYAFIEFADWNSVGLAVTLNNFFLKGRHIKVKPKRSDLPNVITGGCMSPKGAFRGGRPILFQGYQMPRAYFPVAMCHQGVRFSHFARVPVYRESFIRGRAKFHP